MNTRDFDGAFFPGGYGELWDLANDSLAIRMIEERIEAEKPVAMVCHAPAILRDAKKPNGEPLVNGKDVTGFTDAEDTELDLSRHLRFSRDGDRRRNAPNFKRPNANWNPYVVEDGALITGQNPASAAPIAEVLANRLS